jgi:hypothetical protein
MNHFDPDKKGLNGLPELASQFHPLIGPYDSSDPDTLECQTLQMKIAGIDGVIIDWYGTKELYDYPIVSRNTAKIIAACTRAGLKFSVMMEDGNVNNLVKAGKATPEEYATSALNWLRSGWFGLPGFVRWHDEPVLMLFGPQYYKEPELSKYFGQREAFFTELGRKGRAVGAFAWPEPQVGDEKSWNELKSFYERAKGWPAFVGVAYPRFEDIYKAAGVGPGYGEIRDRNGETFRRTLGMAEIAKPPFIQIATWNDWGEGTQIEPSVEFGYRDLAALQSERRRADPAFPYRADDLMTATAIFWKRREKAPRAKVDRAVAELLAGHGARAAAALRG